MLGNDSYLKFTFHVKVKLGSFEGLFMMMIMIEVSALA